MAVRAGLSYGEFWGLTPGEVVDFIADRVGTQRERHQVALYTAWHTALFHRVERLPKFNEVFPSETDEPEPEEVSDKINRIFSRLGGVTDG